MGDKKSAAPIEKRGGYPAGEKPVSQLSPPPKGPGVGSKPAPAPSNEQADAPKN